MPSPISFPSKEKPEQRRSNTGKRGGDPLAAVKAAAWAWLEHELKQPDMTESWHGRTVLKPPLPRPSRYKKEAMEKANNVETCTQPLMDAYEIETITKQIENLVDSSSPSSSSLNNRDHDGKVKERNRARGRFWRNKHRLVCGRSEDVVDDATRLTRIAR
ncbi:hypothetical protein MLD38_034650 [Melastoma candidum]|uniref:Uncharacterized protein n=1 Tax=Melastoma candidum TaxID=119954 RepID=A0ACB9MAM3_9MYRT|nr:hypothetical protein MLD38_034650 [Melastoma candidum]